MLIEWNSILLVLLLVFIALIVIKIIEKRFNINSELKRKSFHVSMGIVMLTFPYIFKSSYSVGALGIIALLIMFILKNTKLKKTIGTVLYSVERESLGEIFFIISVFIVFFLSKGDRVKYSIPILVLTFADSTAALIGKSYGKKNLAELNEDSKSIEGSFMFFVVAFMSTLVPLLLWTEVGREETLIISTIVGFNAALIEMISHTGNDNLLIPLTTYAFVNIHMSQNLELLKLHLVIIGTIYLLVCIANRIKVWSKLALIETLVVGYLTIVLYGWYAAIPPAILFLTVLRLPRRTEEERKNLYDARIIETNIIIGVSLCGLVAITGLKNEFFLIYSTCYAMHLIINTYVRLKYYFKYNEVYSILFSFIKGVILIFLPSLFIYQIILNAQIDLVLFILMVISMFVSSVLIYYKKKNIVIEEVSKDNGYMHMSIVLFFTIILCSVKFYQIIFV